MNNIGANLFVVLWVGAVSVFIQQGVLLPYLRVAAVAGTDPAQQLLQFGAKGRSLLPLAVRHVLNNCSDQDLHNLPWGQINDTYVNNAFVFKDKSQFIKPQHHYM